MKTFEEKLNDVFGCNIAEEMQKAETQLVLESFIDALNNLDEGGKKALEEAVAVSQMTKSPIGQFLMNPGTVEELIEAIRTTWPDANSFQVKALAEAARRHLRADPAVAFARIMDTAMALELTMASGLSPSID